MGMITKVDTNNIKISWECTKCNVTAACSLPEIIESGIPICPECGDDMSLCESVDVTL